MPTPKTPEIRERFRHQRRRDTCPEMALRRVLHHRGLRYRVDLSPIVGMRSRADIVFTQAKVAVFVDGCFWHGCPQHATAPKSNAEWWRQKIEANRQRDERVTSQLRQADWAVERVWEHEDPEMAADRIVDLVSSRRSPPGERALSSDCLVPRWQ